MSDRLVVNPPTGVPGLSWLEFVKDGVNSWFVDYDDTVEAQATLARIVASGLDEASLRKSIPEFADMGSKLRGADFAMELEKSVIVPAAEVGKQQCLGSFSELAKRVFALVSCVCLWFILRVFTRIGFVVLRDPDFEVLGPLGGAVDDKKVPSVLTFPCLRPFFARSSQLAPEPLPDGDGTDYATHYEPARKPFWNRRF